MVKKQYNMMGRITIHLGTKICVRVLFFITTVFKAVMGLEFLLKHETCIFYYHTYHDVEFTLKVFNITTLVYYMLLIYFTVVYFYKLSI